MLKTEGQFEVLIDNTNRFLIVVEKSVRIIILRLITRCGAGIFFLSPLMLKDMRYRGSIQLFVPFLICGKYQAAQSAKALHFSSARRDRQPAQGLYRGQVTLG